MGQQEGCCRCQSQQARYRVFLVRLLKVFSVLVIPISSFASGSAIIPYFDTPLHYKVLIHLHKLTGLVRIFLLPNFLPLPSISQFLDFLQLRLSFHSLSPTQLCRHLTYIHVLSLFLLSLCLLFLCPNNLCLSCLSLCCRFFPEFS